MEEQHIYQDICQSCGMPMKIVSDYGTKQDGSQNFEYCKYCYQKGAFLQPDITLDQMIKGNIGIMVKYGMSEEEARSLMAKTLPTLKRWN